jgi:FKBP-type peptidyl-prolyl cis-trans isomerase 2
MQTEKIAIIVLAVIVIVALSTFLVLSFYGDIFENLFGGNGGTAETGEIELGDCADVNYIGRYASNNTIFDSSYNDTINKTGGSPLKVFVSINSSESSFKDGYTTVIEGFAEGLVGLKEGETKTIGPIPPEKAYGVIPKVGDIIDLTELAGTNMSYRIVQIIENATMPEEYEDIGSGNTTLYVIREDWHYVGEKINQTSSHFKYFSWENGSIVTKINETMLWIYTTPTTEVGENFTWIELDYETGMIVTYPENTSYISSINESTIVVQNNPTVGQEIILASYYYGSLTYTIENITSEKINASTGTGDEKSYMEFDRQLIIQRNESVNITYSFPEPIFQQLLSQLKSSIKNFNLSLAPLAGESLIFDVEVVKVYKNPQDES